MPDEIKKGFSFGSALLGQGAGFGIKALTDLLFNKPAQFDFNIPEVNKFITQAAEKGTQTIQNVGTAATSSASARLGTSGLTGGINEPVFRGITSKTQSNLSNFLTDLESNRFDILRSINQMNQRATNLKNQRRLNLGGELGEAVSGITGALYDASESQKRADESQEDVDESQEDVDLKQGLFSKIFESLGKGTGKTGTAGTVNDSNQFDINSIDLLQLLELIKSLNPSNLGDPSAFESNQTGGVAGF